MKTFLRRLAVVSAALQAMLICPPSEASWFGKIVREAGEAGSKAGRSTLDNATQHLKTHPPGTKAAEIAATVSQEGHWTFANKAGERLTTASPDELKRALALLSPEVASGDTKLTLLLTEDVVFRHRDSLKDLPAGADLRLVSGREVYRVMPRADGGTSRLLAEIRPRLAVEIGELKAFREAVWQLERPLERSGTRLLALEPGGPQSLPSVPTPDAQTGRAIADTVDPFRMSQALQGLRGQTVIVIGRSDGENLYFRPSSGPEQTLPLKDVMRAVEAADVNLILLDTPQTRQPGSRNWLWQRIEVAGLDHALKRVRMADFLDALAGSDRHLVVRTVQLGDMRTSLRATPVKGTLDAPSSSGMGDVLSEVVSDITGRIVPSIVEANLTSEERAREIGARIVPGIPSDVQFGYVGLIIVGLMGLPAARRWWGRVWPAEQRGEYSGASGYHAARLVKGLVFVALFLPVVAVPALLRTIIAQIWSIVTLPVRAWHSLTHRRASAHATEVSVGG